MIERYFGGKVSPRIFAYREGWLTREMTSITVNYLACFDLVVIFGYVGTLEVNIVWYMQHSESQTIPELAQVTTAYIPMEASRHWQVHTRAPCA